jgi:hypothetical protein
LLLVFLILLTTCAEITMLFTYFQLCSEDYYWWWGAFTMPDRLPFMSFYIRWSILSNWKCPPWQHTSCALDTWDWRVSDSSSWWDSSVSHRLSISIGSFLDPSGEKQTVASKGILESTCCITIFY